MILGLGQGEFAERAGVHVQQLKQWRTEKGQRPPARRLLAWAKREGWPERIFAENGPMPSEVRDLLLKAKERQAQPAPLEPPHPGALSDAIKAINLRALGDLLIAAEATGRGFTPGEVAQLAALYRTATAPVVDPAASVIEAGELLDSVFDENPPSEEGGPPSEAAG